MIDPNQFEVFMRNHQDMVFSTALRITANPTEAQDISQEVFLRAYAHFEELKFSPTAGGWLRTVATNLSLNHLSRYRLRWSFFSELFKTKDQEQGFEVEFPAATDVAVDVDHLERHELVERALQSLPTSQRVPLVLYHMEGYKYEEIATKLNISLGKVKIDIFRGREALRKKLRSKLREPAESARP